jgi:hypothetical protein
MYVNCTADDCYYNARWKNRGCDCVCPNLVTSTQIDELGEVERVCLSKVKVSNEK